jgi:hypothetical protein
MRVDEGRCYKMWIRIFVLYVRPFKGQFTHSKKRSGGVSRFGLLLNFVILFKIR